MRVTQYVIACALHGLHAQRLLRHHNSFLFPRRPNKHLVNKEIFRYFLDITAQLQINMGRTDKTKLAKANKMKKTEENDNESVNKVIKSVVRKCVRSRSRSNSNDIQNPEIVKDRTNPSKKCY